jgi:hypothetical protein
MRLLLLFRLLFKRRRFNLRTSLFPTRFTAVSWRISERRPASPQRFPEKECIR